MKQAKFICMLVVPVVLCYSFFAQAVESNTTDAEKHIWQRETLTGGLFGLEEPLSEKGMELSVSSTQIYQQNLRGGLSTHRRAGRFSGSYDVELDADLQKLLGFESGSIYIHGEGGWPDTEGIDTGSVGSSFGVNADSIGNRSFDIVELFYYGPVFDESLEIMIGKIDFTWVFDASAYADDECTQFLNGAFVDNPTIPFPDYSLGVVLTWNLADNIYVMGGIADAQADGRETGFNTAFHDEDYFLYLVESGVRGNLESENGQMPGTYRFGMWVDGQDKRRYSDNSVYRDDTGFYLSCDQMVYKETSDPVDSQGLGLFTRYGYANSDLNQIGNFWSIGMQYQGLFEERDEDVLGLAFAKGVLSDYNAAGFTDDYETVTELYYSVSLAPWVRLSPNLQYITDPGGNGTADDALFLGLRTQITF